MPSYVILDTSVLIDYFRARNKPKEGTKHNTVPMLNWRKRHEYT